MICEICGRNVDKLYEIYIEGARVKVCIYCFSQIKKTEIKEVNKVKTKKDIEIVGEVIVEDFNKKLREYRERNNLKQIDMAKLLGIKESLYKALEEGRIKPDINLAKKIEKILKIKILEKEVLTDKEKESNLNLRVSDVIKFEE